MSDQKEICNVMFRHIGDKRFHCVICLNRKDEHDPLVSEQGYGNLMNHLKSKLHKNEWEEIYKSFSVNKVDNTQKLPFQVVKASTQAMLRYRVINVILQSHLPTNIVERPSFRELVNHDEFTTAKTLKKCMLKLHDIVICEIGKKLPTKFGIVLDGWSDGSSNHMVSFFASCPLSNGCELILIGMNVLDDITNQSAQNHVDTLRSILFKYGKDLSNVNFLVADNTNLNPCIANLLRVPFIGCASHKLNLAIRKFLIDNDCVIDKVDNVMKRIANSNVISGHLKEAQKALNKPLLRPIIRNLTRWSSTHNMLVRYVRIEEVLRDERMAQIHSIVLSVIELTKCKELLNVLDQLEFANKELQKDGLTLDYVRTLFDQIVEDFGHLSSAFGQYLRVSPTNHFENGIVALLRNQELSRYQKVHLRRFLLSDETSVTQETRAESERPLTLKEKVEQQTKKQKTEHSNHESYLSMYHVIPTSNCCERINSQARLEKDYTRMSASNKMFEVRMMLRANKSYWSALTIDKILTREKSSANSESEEQVIVAIEEDDIATTREFTMDAPRAIECPEVSDEDIVLALTVNDNNQAGY
jgi:hypothetical protein